MSHLKARIFSVDAVGYSARPLVNIQKASHSVTSAMEIVKSHLLGVNYVVFKIVNPCLPEMHSCKCVNAVPLGLVGEVGGGESYVALEHPGEALLLVVRRRPQVNSSRYISSAIFVLCSAVY